MNIDWDQSFLFGLPLNFWAGGIALLLFPHVARIAWRTVRDALMTVSRNLERTIITLGMLGGGLLTFSHVSDSPVTGSEVLRMIIGAFAYFLGFYGLADLNRREERSRKESSKHEPSDSRKKAFSGNEPPNTPTDQRQQD